MLTTTRRLAVALIAFLVWAPAASAWSWPADGPVLEPFVYDEAHPYAPGQHRGIDIGAGAAGETVAAPATGTVSFAGTVPTSGESVTIETSDGYSVTLTHLGSLLVAEGATVAEGDAVGTVGPSGTPEVDGPYVHLGIRVTADPLGYVDPLSLLPPPVAQSPPSDSGSGSAASQPTAGSGTSAAPPAAAPAVAAPAPAATSAPVATARGSRAAPSRSRASHPGRGRVSGSRPELERIRSSRRPSEPAPTAGTTAPHDAAKRQRRPSEPTHSSQRPVPEAPVASGASTGLGAGHPSPPTVHVAEPFRRPGARTSPGLLPLVLDGASALVAVAAALAAAWRRHRGTVNVRASAQVLQLPRSPSHDSPERRAA